MKWSRELSQFVRSVMFWSNNTIHIKELELWSLVERPTCSAYQNIPKMGFHMLKTFDDLYVRVQIRWLFDMYSCATWACYIVIKIDCPWVSVLDMTLSSRSLLPITSMTVTRMDDLHICSWPTCIQYGQHWIDIDSLVAHCICYL